MLFFNFFNFSIIQYIILLLSNIDLFFPLCIIIIGIILLKYLFGGSFWTGGASKLSLLASKSSSYTIIETTKS